MEALGKIGRFLIFDGPFWDHWRRGINGIAALLAPILASVIMSVFCAGFIAWVFSLFVRDIEIDDLEHHHWKLALGLVCLFWMPYFISAQFENGTFMEPLSSAKPGRGN